MNTIENTSKLTKELEIEDNRNETKKLLASLDLDISWTSLLPEIIKPNNEKINWIIISNLLKSKAIKSDSNKFQKLKAIA